MDKQIDPDALTEEQCQISDGLVGRISQIFDQALGDATKLIRVEMAALSRPSPEPKGDV